ncbi:tRNA (guanine-N(1)-)-methyltransferase [Oribacterium sp. oral taxon 078 str. F0263]|uniref:tRNA (guanosine(37)-N1)-methyltransferase TrmD n=1 Tax=Oribacterium sp. oral taxon 078 TaxID=652706 RepID=UPI0003AD79B2|nr:tRNA (guanosine(37)-N1)-methyltransferase TrmD [Oribacterium sp. oral taxon 078]ERL05288.1 tRNA (guanine-N(1)-)-methyltransferase [Oribacterium sp. oral taxon 078 str. F0263]
MKSYYVMTLFPEMIENAASFSITGRAIRDEKISVKAFDIRDYTKDPHRHVDDAPYGGGAGMLMQVQPIHDCFLAILEHCGGIPRVLHLSPQGRCFDQRLAEELAKEEELVFLCGHYEGVDERALELLHTENISIGDYVLTGGELPALVMIDAISRLVSGVLNKEASHEIESFSNGLLEYPQYTRPEIYEGKKVPEILLSGDHKKVDCWRQRQSLLRTKERRPELYEAYIRSHPEEALEGAE